MDKAVRWHLPALPITAGGMVMCAYLPPVNLLQTFKGTLTIPLVSVSFLSVGGAKLKNNELDKIRSV
jgi:hypothetical protein